MTQALAWMSAVELAEQIRRKAISPVEVIDAVLAQADRLNPQLNALVTRIDDAARAAAQAAETAVLRGAELGPLHGVPFSAKDLHFTAGVRTTLGSELYRDFVPTFDHPMVARLRAAGAILIGKTNTSEFGLLPLAQSRLWGECHNPWNTALNTGGSSGGAAACVACGMGPLATASDGGGSIRIPAAFCGVFGIKPQHGRIPHVHQPPGWENLSHQGPLTRTVRDAARVLDVCAGTDLRDRWSLARPEASFEAACRGDVRGLRLAWSPDFGGLPCEANVLASCAQAARRFEDLGCHVDLVRLELPDLSAAQQVIVQCETAAAIHDRRAEWLDCITPSMARMLDKADALSYRDLLQAHWQRERYCEAIAPVFATYDALLTPTVGITAPENGSLGPRVVGGQKIRALAWLAYCVPANMTWQPALSLPAPRTPEGLPVGLQVIGRPHDEATILRLAANYEAAWPWFECPPVAAPAAPK
ncbi:MAG: amidase [Pirellulales bacterium]|nr:amidase [Pirellulales bacterium]